MGNTLKSARLHVTMLNCCTEALARDQGVHCHALMRPRGVQGHELALAGSLRRPASGCARRSMGLIRSPSRLLSLAARRGS